MTRRRLLALAVALFSFVSLVPSAVGTDTPERGLRILVKLHSPLAQAIESALPLTKMALLAGESGKADIEAFLSRHSIQKIAPLHPEIVRLKKTNGLSDLEIATGIRQRFVKRANRLRAAFQPPEISRTYVLERATISRKGLAEILNNLKADPEVEFAEEDKFISVNLTPNDPYFSTTGSWGQSYDDLWGIKRIGAPAAWDTNTGTGVIVAVVDTGIDYNHPDIASNVWINTKEIPGNGVDDDHNGFIDDVRGWDFIGSTYTNPQQSNDPIDHFGHGTHVAGTIAALGNNGIGVIGVAWHAQVMAVKGLDDQGFGLDSTLSSAIIYAANNGADVINASWRGPGTSQTIADAVSYAYNLGVVFVAAAGNDATDARNYYPANLWNVITVAASDPNDNLAAFSNFGSKIDVTAPGVDILSLQASGTQMGTTVSPGYTRASGTSMATPHVSGLAALILSQNASYSNEDVRQVLRVSATDLGAPSYDLTYGYGRISASSALGVTSVLEAKINSPLDGTVTQGALTISGVARGAGFSHYTLEYGAGALPTTWTTINTSTTQVYDGTLGVFDSSSLADGVYDVRLTAFNASSQAFVDRIQIVVHSVFILSPTPPPCPTSATTFKNGALIPITGTAVGGNFVNFQVDWAPGLDPSSGWQNTGITLMGQGLTPVSNGPLADWDTSSISGAGYYTLRLTVNKMNSTYQALTMVYFEPDLLSFNWPQLLDQGPYLSAGVVPAKNADGTTRLVVQSPSEGSGFGEFWTLTQTAAPQQSLLLGRGSFQQPAVADLDGNPGEEAAVADSVGIEVVRPDGTSFPLSINTTLDYQRSQVVIEDLLGDSHWETLALGSDYNSQLAYISAWRADGSLPNKNFPIQIADQNPVNTWLNRTRFLVGDVDGDGKKEIVAQEGLSSTTFTLGLFANDGSPRAWSVPVLTGMPEAMIAADLDHNGKLETILVLYSGTSNDQAIMHVFQPDGTERVGWPVVLPNPNQYSESFLAVGDLNQDGHYEIIYSHETYLYVLKDDGTIFSNAWPLQASANIGYGSVVIGDVDGDGFPEIVTTLNLVTSTPDPFFTTGGAYYDEKLLAIRRDGTVSKSWQLTASNGYALYAYPAPAIGDFNQDGITDIAVAYEVTGSPTSVPGIVTIVRTGAKYNPVLNDWPLIHHDPRNSNILQNPSGSTSSTATTISSSANPSVFGQSVTFTAVVTALSSGANTPTGKVGFLDGTTSIGNCTLASGNCTLMSSSLAAGTHTITAHYAGDAHSTVSMSAALSQVVIPANFSLDTEISADNNSAAASITSPSLSTSFGNELLLAFIATDAKSANMTVSSVSGAGLTWALVRRTNAQLGTAEVWRAFATAPLSNVIVTATLAQSVAASITIMTFAGADAAGTNGSGAIGATAGASAASGAPSATLVTTHNNSWVLGVGSDWDNAIVRTLGPNQTLVHQFMPSVGDTYWVQRQNSATPQSGTSVTINDTAPATDRFNLTLVEVLPSAIVASGISGTITNGSGATVTLSGSASATTIADASGNYTFSGLANGVYTVTPSKSGFTFTPASQNVTVNNANVTGVNFIMVTYSITGTISGPGGNGATVNLTATSSATVTANASGNYSFTGLANGSYMVTPSKTGFTFTPASQAVTVNNANVTAVNFSTVTYSISGTISGAGGSGSTVNLTGASTATTTADTSGNYSFTGLVNGSYTITPSKSRFTFTPVNAAATVSGDNVTGVNFTSTAAAGLAIDKSVSTVRSSQSSTIVTPAFTTAAANELLLAFVSADAPSSGTNTTVSSIAGGGLTWVLVRRTNTQLGTAEVWRAFAPAVLSNVTVTAILSRSTAASMTVVTFTGVDTSGTSGSGAIGATASGNAASGTPTANLSTTRNNSWVFGVGTDWDNATARTVPANQTMVHQYLATVGDTYWVQRMTSTTPASGTVVTINDTAPTADRYNLTIVEVLPSL